MSKVPNTADSTVAAHFEMYLKPESKQTDAVYKHL